MKVKNEISKFDVLKLFITGVIYKTFQVLGKRKFIYSIVLLILLVSLIFDNLIIKFTSVALIIIVLSEKSLNKALSVNRFTGELHMSFEEIKEFKSERDPYKRLNILVNKFNDGVLKLADSKDPFIVCKKQFHANTNEIIYKAFYRKYKGKLIAIQRKHKEYIKERFLICSFKDLFISKNYKHFNRKVNMYKIIFYKDDILSLQ